MIFHTLCFKPGPWAYDFEPGTIQIGISDQTLLRCIPKIMAQVEEAVNEIGLAKGPVSFEWMVSEKGKNKRGDLSNKRDPFKNEVVNPGERVRFSKESDDLPRKIEFPLFLIGGLRLEATSLLAEIRRAILVNHPDQKITFLSSEEFMNNLITAVSGDITGAFRKRYQNLDILIIDEIQFLLGKDWEMEVFFQTVSTMRTDSNKW